jgi:tellurium resistance protein TerD
MINLEKKKPFNLTKAAPALNNVKVGLSWDETILNGQSPDADASVFMLGENGKLPSEGFFVFYNNLNSSDGSISHSGDNRTGAGDGDDEEINITLSRVSSQVVQIMVTITIHNMEDGFHFGNVKNASVRIYNATNNEVLCQYQLTESFDGCDSLIIGRFFRNGSEWEFEAMGHAFAGGLGATIDLYQ